MVLYLPCPSSNLLPDIADPYLIKLLTNERGQRYPCFPTHTLAPAHERKQLGGTDTSRSIVSAKVSYATFAICDVVGHFLLHMNTMPLEEFAHTPFTAYCF